MTIELLREHPAFVEAWGTVWPMLNKFLIKRALDRAAGGKCTLETSQGEAAVNRELAQLLRELESIGAPAAEKSTAPVMRPLHSMSGEDKPAR